MKKIILHSLFCVACFAFITGCSKDVKAPAKKTTATANTTMTTTQTQTTNQQGHTCGGGSNTSSSHDGGTY